MKKIVTVALALMLVLAMSATVFADNFVPSVGQKEVPSVFSATVTNVDGTKFVATGIKIIPCKYAMDDANFKAAYNEVKNAASFTELVPGLSDALPAGVTDADLIVSDMFDVTPDMATSAALSAGGAVTVRFQVKSVVKGDVVIAIHKGVNGWEVVPTEVTGNETVVTTFSDLSPVAFLSLKNVTVNGTVVSPATGDAVALAAGIVRACAAVIR